MSTVKNSLNPSNPKPPELPPKKSYFARAIEAYADAYNQGRPSEVCKRSLPDHCNHSDFYKKEECQKIFKECVEFWKRFDRWQG
jgi:hypothetical protein